MQACSPTARRPTARKPTARKPTARRPTAPRPAPTRAPSSSQASSSTAAASCTPDRERTPMSSLPPVAVLLASLALGCAGRAGAPVGEGAVLVARDEGGGDVTLRVDGVMRDPKD